MTKDKLPGAELRVSWVPLFVVVRSGKEPAITGVDL